jgi:predicted nucleic-acid-binding Zn-ribbon protein
LELQVFIITWGHKSAEAVLDNLGMCASCGDDTLCNVTLYYNYLGLFWVFNVSTDKLITVYCKACGKSKKIPYWIRLRVINKLIPYMDRFGLLGLATGFALLVARNFLTE